MNISRINKDFVNRMNKFLTTGDIESFDGMFGITFSDFRIGPQGGSSVRDTSDNFISSLNDSNVTISEEECYAAFIAINFPEISTFNLPVKLIKFSEYADRFTNFRIDKFTSLLNDPNEMKWLANYDSRFDIFKDNAIALRDSGRILATYSTINLEQKKYMIANYSPCRKKAAVYPGDKVNENFDETFGSKLKPFRGYVRYGGEKQQVIMLFDHLKNESRINDSELELAFTIMSFFVKGCQMKPEQEYRHLILMTNESISSIELNAEKDFSIDFSDISGLVRNEYYEPNDCNDSFVADLYDCSYTITRNQYTDD